MPLRPYQEQASFDIRKLLKTHPSSLLNLPTGAGKTMIAANIVERAANKDIISVFLVDRKELADKTHSDFLKHGIECQFVDAKTTTIYRSKVYISLTETFFRRISKGWFSSVKIGLMVLDECHMAAHYKSVALLKERNPDMYVIGLTATPVSSAKTHPLNKYFTGFVGGPTVPELVEQGFLVPSIDIGQDKLLSLHVQGGEFTALSQREQFSQHGIDQKMIKAWLTHAKDRQTICYNINIEHNLEVMELFKSIGVSADAISSRSTEKEREYSLLRYAYGDCQVLCNVGILTKGFDSPRTSCIVANFSTTSISKWYQVIGRGARPYPGKNNFITIDMGNNLLFHGSYNEAIDWKAIFDNDARDKNFRVKPNQYLCSVCSAYITNIYVPMCHVCACNLAKMKPIPLENCMPEELKTTPVEDMTFKQLTDYAKYKGYKNGWAYFTNGQNLMRRQNKKELI